MRYDIKTTLRNKSVVVDSISFEESVEDSYVDFAYWESFTWVGDLANKLYRLPILGKKLHKLLWDLAELSTDDLDKLSEELAADGSLYDLWWDYKVIEAEDAYDSWCDR